MERTDRRPRWVTVACAALVGIVSLPLGNSQTVLAQVREVVKPVRIVQIYGRDTLSVGELETYRVRVNAPYETAYRWRITGGDEIGGNPIVYRFDEPGSYELIATARNPKGSDSDTLVITVLGHRPRPTSLASNQESKPVNIASTEPKTEQGEAKPTDPSKPADKATTGLKRDVKSFKPKAAGFKGEAGGKYTWVIATYFQRDRADALANAYRAVGFRSSVYIDTGGKGSTVFRVTLGRFDSEERALEAKAEVKSHGIRNPLLHQLNGA